MQDKAVLSTIQKLKGGDTDAFELVYNYYNRDIYRYAYYLCRDHEDAEDIAQEVFIRIWKKRESICPDKSFTGYIMRIAHNLCMTHLDKKWRDQRNRSTYATVKLEAERTQPFDMEELGVSLSNSINNIRPHTTRLAFMFAHILKIPHKEIAKRLNLNKGSVGNYVCNAFRQIRDSMKNNIGL